VLVLWDRDCGFCAWMLALILRADSRRVLRTGTIQENEASGLLMGISPERRYASWHVVDADGHVTSGGRALTKVLSALPAGRPVAILTGALPGLTERAYDWVATHRRLLSRPIPSAAKQRARSRVEARAVGAPPDLRRRAS
jgi:predicted DCC family thiol-disulfide oxidoreductase YuxK